MHEEWISIEERGEPVDDRRVQIKGTKKVGGEERPFEAEAEWRGSEWIGTDGARFPAASFAVTHWRPEPKKRARPVFESLGKRR